MGDATNDAILKEAGIERARVLLAASDSDAGNTFIVLTAKALNPTLFVVARAAQPVSEPRMLRAGADRVFSPYTIAGKQMALTALHPMVVEFIDTLASRQDGAPVLAEIDVSDVSGLAGRTIHDILHSAASVIVLGLQSATGELQVGSAERSRPPRRRPRHRHGPGEGAGGDPAGEVIRSTKSGSAYFGESYSWLWLT